MSLHPCVECGNPVSSTAKRCPACGRYDPSMPLMSKILGGIMIIVLIGVCDAYETRGRHHDQPEPTPVAVEAQPVRHHKASKHTSGIAGPAIDALHAVDLQIDQPNMNRLTP